MEFNLVITISREYGSGGREIGRRVARKLNIPFYDKSISELAAIATGLKPEVIEAFQDRTPTGFDYGAYSTGSFVPISDELFGTQVKIIKKLAEKPCIIIGRASDYILKDYPNLVRIFIIAKKEDRIKKIASTYHVTEKEAIKAIKQCDKQRAKYHEHYADTKWGDPHSYDLVVNSSMGVDHAVSAILGFLDSINKDQ